MFWLPGALHPDFVAPGAVGLAHVEILCTDAPVHHCTPRTWCTECTGASGSLHQYFTTRRRTRSGTLRIQHFLLGIASLKTMHWIQKVPEHARFSNFAIGNLKRQNRTKTLDRSLSLVHKRPARYIRRAKSHYLQFDLKYNFEYMCSTKSSSKLNLLK